MKKLRRDVRKAASAIDAAQDSSFCASPGNGLRTAQYLHRAKLYLALASAVIDAETRELSPSQLAESKAIIRRLKAICA